MNPHEPSTTFDVASFDADALKARDHARCDATYLRATLIRNTGKALLLARTGGTSTCWVRAAGCSARWDTGGRLEAIDPQPDRPGPPTLRSKIVRLTLKPWCRAKLVAAGVI